MGRKIAVLGAGAIGSSVGADLTKAGLDVFFYLKAESVPAVFDALAAELPACSVALAAPTP